MKRVLTCSVLALVATMLATPAIAQIPTGVLGGRVIDPDGAPLPGVTIEATSPDLMGVRTGTTGTNGSFRLPALPPGDYTLVCTLVGFKTIRHEGLIVNLNTTTSLNMAMELATVEETITVTGMSPVVDVKSTNVGQVMTEEILQNIPNARDVWVVLEQVPAMVMDRFNVGGSESGQQSRFSAGAGPSQNAYNFDGIDITDMTSTGASTYFPYDAFSEVQVSTSAHKAEVATPGVVLNIVTRSGRNAFHGLESFYYETPSLQADNITDELRAAGLEAGDKLHKYTDFSLSLGGAFVKDKLWFYVTHQQQRPEAEPIGFTRTSGEQGINSTALKHFLYKLDWQVNEDHKLSGSWHNSVKDRPWRNGASYAQSGPGTLLAQASWKNIPQLHWTSVFGSNAFMDLSYGVMNMNWPLAPDADNTGQTSLYEYRSADSYPDAPVTPWRRGYNQSYYRYNIYNRDRIQYGGTFSYFQDDWLGGDHDLKAGVSHFTFESDTVEYSFGGIRLGYRDGIPYNIRAENHRQNQIYSEKSTGFFVQDTASIGDKVTLNLGLRADMWNLYLPAQQGYDTPFCSTFGDTYSAYCANSYPAVDDIVDWFNVAPRVGVIYDVFGDGRTAVKANWSRYYNQVGNWVANFVNQNGYIYGYWRWSDLNGDNEWQPGEEADAPYSLTQAQANRVEADLKQPYTDEWVFAVEHELMEDLALSLTTTFRTDKDLAEDVNAGIPYSAYTLETFENLGYTFQAYNLDPAWVGTGNEYVITNPGTVLGQPFENKYKAVTLKAVKRMSNNWQMLAAYTWSKSEGWREDGGGNASGLLDSPNNDLFAYGRQFFDRPHVFKLSMSARLPLDINGGAFIRMQSGQPYNRDIETPVRLNQGWVIVPVEAMGESRLPTVKTLDLRASKVFALPLGELEAMFDVFNVTNTNTITNQGDEIGNDLGEIYEIIPPRIARIGIKWTF